VLDCIRILDAVLILIFDGLRLSGIERSNYIESNNLGPKSCPVSGIERIRYSGCFITLKIEGENSGPTKSSGFIGIPVLRGSGLEGFYCTTTSVTLNCVPATWRSNCVQQRSRRQWERHKRYRIRLETPRLTVLKVVRHIEMPKAFQHVSSP